MKLPGESPLESEISGFAEVIHCGENGGDPPVIVGGHAAGLWSRYYLAMGVDELSDFLPFRSKDLDLVGNMELLEQLQRRVKGTMLRSEPRSPVFGRLDIPQPGGGFLRVEVLHSVLGLNQNDLARTMNIEVEGVVGRVPLPHLILEAKLANSALIPQEGRQDVKHARMMLLCTRATRLTKYPENRLFGRHSDQVPDIVAGNPNRHPDLNPWRELRAFPVWISRRLPAVRG